MRPGRAIGDRAVLILGDRMRLSAEPSSPHWRPEAMRAKVYLDGDEQSLVVEADEDAGWLKRCKVDAEGRLIENPAGDGVAIETLRGVVRVDIEDSYAL